jgi:putative aldouronate transport system permease protein
MKRVKPIYKCIIYLVLILTAVCCIYPFVLVLGSSLQSQNEIMSIGYKAIPKAATLEAYKSIFASPERIIDSYVITIVTSLIVTLAGTWMTATMGYVISRRDYKYRRALSFFIFFTMMFNGGLVPTYILISKWLHMSDTIWALIVPILMSAWNIMLMKGFFAALPGALIESAKLDGASELLTFVRIIIPISTPAFATVALFTLLGAWNSWMPSMLYTENPKLFTLQYVLQQVMNNISFLNSDKALQYGMVNESTQIPTYSVRMAMCIVTSGPVLVIFPFFQKYFTQGLTVGSLKG